MKLACILFDLDGTLLDTHDLILESMQYATREVLACIVPDDELMALVGQPLDLQMQLLARDYGKPERAAELSSVYRAYNEAIHDERVRTFRGIPELLAALRDVGVRMGVVTSKRHALAVQGLRVTGIDGYFELVIGPDDWPEAKPHPGGIVRAMQLLGVLPDRMGEQAASGVSPHATLDESAASTGDYGDVCWYVGDSPFDLQAGNGAGCFTVAALWGMFPRDVLAAQSPDALCETPASVLTLLS